jgi:hypothetical protein
MGLDLQASLRLAIGCMDSTSGDVFVQVSAGGIPLSGSLHHNQAWKAIRAQPGQADVPATVTLNALIAHAQGIGRPVERTDGAVIIKDPTPRPRF